MKRAYNNETDRIVKPKSNAISMAKSVRTRTTSETKQDHPGRPRNEATRQAILETSLRLVHERGYGALSIEAIAREAGVGKQSIYRWWRSKGDIILEALREVSSRDLKPRKGSCLAKTLGNFLKATFHSITRKDGYGPLLRVLMAEAQRDPEFARSFRDQFIQARRSALREMLTAAQCPAPEATVDLDILIDMIFGTLWYRLLVQHAPLDSRLAREMGHLVGRLVQ
jgi:AcrR family transcriptional regulator